VGTSAGRYGQHVLAYDVTVRPGSRTTVVLSHPHPDMGGDRHHPVVQALYDGLAWSTLRFDFTSSALPTAQEDLREAIALAPDPHVVLAGYSFGANVALSIVEPRVLGWCLVAPPLRGVDAQTLAAAGDARPKHLVVPELDQFCPPARAARATDGWEATSIETIAGCDHFLVGCTDLVLAGVGRWLGALAAPGPGD
jgi:alpha/beta superfamily hydrolase